MRVPIFEKSRNLRAGRNFKLRALYKTRKIRKRKKRIGILVSIIIDFDNDFIRSTPLPRIRGQLIFTRLGGKSSPELASSERDEAYALNRPMDDDDATLLTTRCPITRLLSPDTRNIVRN